MTRRTKSFAATSHQQRVLPFEIASQSLLLVLMLIGSCSGSTNTRFISAAPIDWDADQMNDGSEAVF